MDFPKKKLVLSIAMALLCLGSSAATPGLTFLLTNGTKVSFAFSAKPVIFVTSEGITVSTHEQPDVSYLFTEINGFSFAEDVATAIQGVKAGTSATPVFSYGNGVVTVSGLAAYEQVVVYSINGGKANGTKADQAGHANIDISNVPSGTYVVSTGSGVSFKLLKK